MIVHETAHLLHYLKPEHYGLRVRRGQERFVDVEFRHRELAFACEAFSRTARHGDHKARISFDSQETGLKKWQLWYVRPRASEWVADNSGGDGDPSHPQAVWGMMPVVRKNRNLVKRPLNQTILMMQVAKHRHLHNTVTCGHRASVVASRNTLLVGFREGDRRTGVNRPVDANFHVLCLRWRRTGQANAAAAVTTGPGPQ